VEGRGRILVAQDAPSQAPGRLPSSRRAPAISGACPPTVRVSGTPPSFREHEPGRGSCALETMAGPVDGRSVLRIG